MNIIKSKKGLAAICLSLLLCLLLQTHAFAGQHYGTDPTLGYGLYDTTCNKCGEDNPQWIEEESVHYCSNCGGLGMPMSVEEKSLRRKSPSRMKTIGTMMTRTKKRRFPSR